MIDVLFVILPDTLLLDVAGPAEAFRIANQRLRAAGAPPAFALRFVGPLPGCASSVGAVLADLAPLPPSLPAAAWVVLLGQPSGCESALRRPVPRAWSLTRRWLAQVVAPRLAAIAGAGGDRAREGLQDPSRGAPAGAMPAGEGDVRLVTVCAGALLAADAGLLAGRRCTTHHEMLDRLQRLAPRAQVVANRVFVEDGPVASSAGVLAGVDLALHLVGRTCGEALAASVAQTMVAHLRRGSEDVQLSPLLAGRSHLHPAVHRVQQAVSEQPAKDWSLAALAAVAHVTPRHMARLFATHVGQTPRAWVEGIRVAVARDAIRRGAVPKQAIAGAGFGGDRQWRRANRRVPEQAQDGRDLSPRRPAAAGRPRPTGAASPSRRASAS